MLKMRGSDVFTSYQCPPMKSVDNKEEGEVTVTRFVPKEVLEELAGSCLPQFQYPKTLETSEDIASQEFWLIAGFRTTSGASSARLSTAF
jgi:hypothetical protein